MCRTLLYRVTTLRILLPWKKEEEGKEEEEEEATMREKRGEGAWRSEEDVGKKETGRWWKGEEEGKV